MAQQRCDRHRNHAKLLPNHVILSEVWDNNSSSSSACGVLEWKRRHGRTKTSATSKIAGGPRVAEADVLEARYSGTATFLSEAHLRSRGAIAQ